MYAGIGRPARVSAFVGDIILRVRVMARLGAGQRDLRALWLRDGLGVMDRGRKTTPAPTCCLQGGEDEMDELVRRWITEHARNPLSPLPSKN